MADDTVTRTEGSEFRKAESAKRLHEFTQALDVANSRFETEGHKSGPLETIWGPRDRFDRRMAQAFALVTVISGSGLESFDSWNDDIRMNYLDAIHDLIGTARVDADVAFAESRNAAQA